MKFADKPDAPEQGTSGRSQKPLLLVLLALVAVFAYLYFFTGLITPRQEEQPAPPPIAEVKKPLPPRREGEAAAPAGTAKTEPEKAPKADATGQKEKAKSGEPVEGTKSPAPPTPAPAAKAQEKPAPAKVAVPPAKEAAKQGQGTGDQGAAKTAKEAAKPAAKPTTADAAAKKGKKPESTAKENAGSAKPAAAKGETAKAPAGKDAVKAAAKKDAAAKDGGKKASKKADAAKSAAVTLFVGEFVPDKDFLSLQARLKKMGLAPLHKTELKKAKPMNRLYVGEYPDYETGAAQLEKVKKLSGDAFFIEAYGKYRVYAGSYYNARMADQVKAGLSGKGVATTLQKAEVPVSVVRLTAGRFADKAAAAATIKKLKAAGLSPSIVQVTK